MDKDLREEIAKMIYDNRHKTFNGPLNDVRLADKIIKLFAHQSIKDRKDELERFVMHLNEQDPYTPLDGTPRQYVEGKMYDRLAELDKLEHQVSEE